MFFETRTGNCGTSTNARNTHQCNPGFFSIVVLFVIIHLARG